MVVLLSCHARQDRSHVHSTQPAILDLTPEVSSAEGRYMAGCWTTVKSETTLGEC